MRQPKFQINDYVVITTGVTGRVVGVMLDMERDTTVYNVRCVKVDENNLLRSSVVCVEITELTELDFNAEILRQMGFKKEVQNKYRYYSAEPSRMVIDIDYADNAVTALRYGRKIVLDYVYADYVSDLQHIFEALEIDFPNLDAYIAYKCRPRKKVYLHGKGGEHK